MTRAELDDERSFLLDSLEDLERERAVGDLSEADYAALRDRYTRRAAEVLRALDGDASRWTPDDATPTSPPASTRTRTRRRRRWLLVMGSLLVSVGVAVTLVLSQTGIRLPGQTASGSVSLSSAAQLQRTLAQAETLQSSGDDAEATGLYRQVLAQDPTQPVALAQLGWLEFEAGVRAGDAAVLSKAQDTEEAGVRVAPHAYAPRLYLGSMLLAEGDAAGAVVQYQQFLADSPPAAEVDVAKPFIVEAFGKVHEPVPAMP